MIEDNAMKLLIVMWIAAMVMCLGESAVKIFASQGQCASHAEKAGGSARE
jgi:hypothetical protein